MADEVLTPTGGVADGRVDAVSRSEVDSTGAASRVAPLKEELAASVGQPASSAQSKSALPYWMRPAVFPDERFALAEKIANAISASGVMGLTGAPLLAQVRKTGDMKLIEVIIGQTGAEGGMTIELPQDESGVVVEFPVTRHRRLGARIVQVVKYLEGEYGSRFVIPSTYPLTRSDDVAGRAGGVARVATLGTGGVSDMMASMREKRWGSLNDMSVKMAVKFDVFGTAKKMDDEMEKEGVPAYKRSLIRKRVAKMLADYIVVEGR